MKYVPLIGRILFSAVFIMFGFNHFVMGEGMTGMVPDFLPAQTLVVYLTGIVSVGAGLMVLVGFRTKLAALVLALFVLSTALFVHASGFFAGDMNATANFMKDLGLAGGALLINHFGAGPMSMDQKAASTSGDEFGS